jgi:predicted nucleic acid-binding protein
MRYIDTSLLVAYLTPEVGSEAAEDFMLSDGPPIATSSWTEVEFYSALSKKYRTKLLSKVSISDIIESYNAYVSPRLLHIEVSDLDHCEAMALLKGWRTSLRAGDSLHLAIALAHGATVYTLDRGMALAGRLLKIPINLL